MLQSTEVNTSHPKTDVDVARVSADEVYMENSTEREEHVLRETGRIWLGTVGKFCVRPWNFGQVGRTGGHARGYGQGICINPYGLV